jgi:hypothetical protein
MTHLLGFVVAALIFSLMPTHLSAEQSSEDETTVTTLSAEQVENYRFDIPKSQIEVSDLTLGQQAIMSSKRRTAKDLMARRLGIVRLSGTKEDLALLQQVVDRRILRKTQTEEWQAIGILFGDILVREFSLKWVHFEDELGANKALRYRDTENYFFPVTLFSKRVRFDEEIDMFDVYATLEEQIEAVKEFERRPQLPK